MVEDTEYRDLEITSLNEDDHSFTTEDGWSFWCPPKGERNPDGIKPVVGHVARFYGRGVGYPVRGLMLEGQWVFYETADAFAARAEREHWERQEQKTQTFRAEIAARNAVVAALPLPFRVRVERFQRLKGEDWRVNHEPYEVFTCQEAVKIADGFDEPEQIAAFWDANYKTQREYLPALSDNHSGNTLEQAVQLALAYQTQPAILVRMHGALCGLVGCEKYGCWASEIED